MCDLWGSVRPPPEERARRARGQGEGVKGEGILASAARLATGRSLRRGGAGASGRDIGNIRGKVGKPQTTHRGAGIRPQNASNPAGFGFVRFFRAQVRSRFAGDFPRPPAQIRATNSTLSAARAPPRSAPLPTAPPHAALIGHPVRFLRHPAAVLSSTKRAAAFTPPTTLHGSAASFSTGSILSNSRSAPAPSTALAE
jgi:hypothetical protein